MPGARTACSSCTGTGRSRDLGLAATDARRIPAEVRRILTSEWGNIQT